MTAAGFYSPPQLADIKARADAVQLLDQLATKAFGRTPTPLVTFTLPPLGSVPWSQWFAAFSTIMMDSDASHQLALAASLLPTGAQQEQYQQQAQAFLSAWATTNTSCGAGDSPLAMTECGAGFIFADILIGTSWAGRQQFLNWLSSVYLPACDSIKTRVNNWGAWGSFGAVLARGHLGLDTTADTALVGRQIMTMIASDGTLPEEMLRVGSQLWYSYFCMVPLSCSARVIMNRGGVNYFTDPVFGPRLTAAIANVLHMAENPTSATGKPGGTAAAPWPFDLVDAMAEQYNRDDWRTAAAPWAPISYWGHHTGWNFPTLTALAGL